MRGSFLRRQSRHKHDHARHRPLLTRSSSAGRWCDSEALQVGGGLRESQGDFEGFEVRARFGLFEVDSERRQLLREGRDIHLTPKAFDLLALLVGEAPRVVRKNELHDRLWPGTFVSDATLTGLVKELRRALDDRDTASPMIRTAHGVGYAFAQVIEILAAGVPAALKRWLVVGTRR